MEDKFNNCISLFPELGNKENRNRSIEFLSIDDLQVFVKECLKKANYTLTDDDLYLCEIILYLLDRVINLYFNFNFSNN